MPQVKKFKYLGSVLTERGGCEMEAKARVKAGWVKWRELTGVICDRRIPRRLMLKLYKIVIRPVLTHVAETWALRKKKRDLLYRTEMRVLRWIMRISLKEKKRSDEIRKVSRVLCISVKIREQRLKWYGHVMRREDEASIKKALQKPVIEKRSLGRQRKRWKDTIKKDMERKGQAPDDTKDRDVWKRKIRSVNP